MSSSDQTFRGTRRPLRALVGAAALIAVLAGTAGCGSSQASTDGRDGGTVTLRIPDPGNEGVLARGKKDGSLDTALSTVGARVAWTGSAGPFAPAAQAINANQLDVALGSITSAVGALATSPGFTLFAAAQPDPVGEGILVRADSPIRGVADLAGRKVAVNQGGTGEYLLLRALATAGVPADRVQRVYLRPDQSAPAFDSGQVDAWASWSTYVVSALAGGARMLVDGRTLGSDNATVWAVRSAFAREHPEVVRALYTYLHDSSVAYRQNPEPYVNVFTDAGPQSVNGRAKEITLDFARQGSPVEPIGPDLLRRFDAVAQFFVDAGVTKQKVDVGAHVLDVATLPGSRP
ncbi:ABC transporter substrate-binding protein [Micromonospora sp. CPCC 206060]|uniref:ABC transporter substrate-binding protein n=1 Tax=Micromonospora sp. CPCC 206060 TaxID=3122406 RepID=UPI002FF352FB